MIVSQSGSNGRLEREENERTVLSFYQHARMEGGVTDS